ncbi:MAG: hypothetical protein M1819_003412 [Sarea resinae]|nr:MAG: hypothetical protein M1819_003412 [Sarea resinae]
MASPLLTAQVYPNKGLGFLTLGASLHDVLTRLKAQPQIFPKLDLSYSPSQPIETPVLLSLPENGLRLRFDGPDQRLRLIEVLDFAKSKLSYKNSDIVKPAANPRALTLDTPAGPNGPTFRHVYNRLFGPAFPGEYMPPSHRDDGSAQGTYVLSYPGIAFSFPLLASAWSDNVDFVSLLSSQAASPATSMAIFDGSSWADARSHLYTRQPQHPRSIALAGKAKDGGPDEIEQVRIHGEGRIELLRRTAPPFWIVLSETTPQDLIAELGPPDAVYQKNDRRLNIHRTRTVGGDDSRRSSGLSSARRDSTDTDLSSSQTGTDDSDDEAHAISAADHRAMSSSECFFNYFHHGFDIFISQPTCPSPAPPGSSPDSTAPSPEKASVQGSTSHLTATKLLLHANIPGSYPFNRHRRSRWTLEYDASGVHPEPVSSEMAFEDIAGRLREIWKSAYSSEEEERSLQRGMVLNRGWGDSPGSSCELLGGWEESLGGKRKENGDAAAMGEQGLGNTELFGFPGLVFEVLKNGAVSCLTVF